MRTSERRRIIVVDDEPAIADTLETIFRNAGYDAVAYHDGKSALVACTACAPDLLISDLVMPGIGGMELAILIQQRCPGCRVLLFSGLGDGFSARTEYPGPFAILEKPIRPEELLQKIATTLANGSAPQSPEPDRSR